MAHSSTIIAQMLRLISRHEFESMAEEHHHGCAFRAASRWSRSAAMAAARLSGRKSLRDIAENMAAQGRRLHRLGCTALPRSTPARLNRDQPYILYKKLSAGLLSCCRGAVPGRRFSFKSPMYSLDSTVFSLSMSLFPWARSRSSRGGIKLHVLLNHRGRLPEFVLMTEGKCPDIRAARSMDLPRGSIIVMDRGYADYAWYKQLSDEGIFFISRLKRHAWYRTAERRQAELFFKFISQSLRIRSFAGTGRNAVLTQIRIAPCVHLLLPFIRFRSKLGRSLTRMLRLLQLSLLERRNLPELLRGEPPPPEKPALSPNQLVLL